MFWTPRTDGEKQLIEVYLPAGVPRSATRLQAPQLSHLLANSLNDFKIIEKIGESGSCNVDTACRVGELGVEFRQRQERRRPHAVRHRGRRDLHLHRHLARRQRHHLADPLFLFRQPLHRQPDGGLHPQYLLEVRSHRLAAAGWRRRRSSSRAARPSCIPIRTPAPRQQRHRRPAASPQQHTSGGCRVRGLGFGAAGQFQQHHRHPPSFRRCEEGLLGQADVGRCVTRTRWPGSAAPPRAAAAARACSPPMPPATTCVAACMAAPLVRQQRLDRECGESRLLLALRCGVPAYQQWLAPATPMRIRVNGSQPRVPGRPAATGLQRPHCLSARTRRGSASGPGSTSPDNAPRRSKRTQSAHARALD